MSSEFVINVYLIFVAVCFYLTVGAVIGMIIDILDNGVMIASIFFWPIVLPVWAIICLVKTIRRLIDEA